MTKQEIIDYKVIKDSEKAKDRFNKALLSGSHEVLGDFKNEFGELFVVYGFSSPELKGLYFVTGDEFGWAEGYQPIKDLHNKTLIVEPFMMSKEEQKQMDVLLDSIQKQNK